MESKPEQRSSFLGGFLSNLKNKIKQLSGRTSNASSKRQSVFNEIELEPK
jgi:hypothetical protein